MPSFLGFKRVTDRRGNVTYESTITLTYDVGGRLTKIDDSTGGVVNRTYDDLDRLSSETTPRGTVTYGFDNASRRTSMTVSGQANPVTYSYDDANRLTGVSQGTASVTLVYDASGRRDLVTLPNGVVQDYGYDAVSRITSIAYRNGATALGDLAYGYDALGRATSLFGSLASTQLPAATLTGTNAPAYNAANRLTRWNGTTISYDLNGNMLGDGSKTYVWNARDELTQVRSGTTVVGSFSYDGLGRRTQKTVSGLITRYLYDGLNVIQEQDGTGAVSANLLAGLGLDETYRRTTGASRDLLTDALGSVIGLTDASGAIRTSYSYEPFGATVASGDVDTNPFGFTGRENDGAATGLYFLRARYYNPTFQRFVSEDPIGFAGSGVNLYAYVGNSPVNFVDRRGLEREDGGCGIARNITITLLVLEITLAQDACSGLHVSQLGIGLGTPGVSSTYSPGGGPCFGLEGSLGRGPVTVSGEVGLDDDGTLGAGVDVGVGVGVDEFVPVIPDVGAFLTFGCG